MNKADFMIIVLLGLALTLAIRSIRQEKKKGSCTACGGSCPHCYPSYRKGVVKEKKN